MPAIASVQCPHCRRDIKINNPALLGKKVKCPGCGQSFLAQPSVALVEEEVPLRLAADALPVGTAPRLVSDATLPPPVVNPRPQPRPTGTVPVLPPPVLNPQPGFSAGPANPATSARFEPPRVGAPNVPAIPPTTSATAELDRLRKRGKKGTWLWVVFGVIGLAIAGGVGYFISQQPAKTLTATEGTLPEAAGGTTLEEPVRGSGPYSVRQLELSPELVREFQPTQGTPIDLRMLPDGVNFIIHLRPALMWSEEFDYQVLRAALTEDVTNWLAAKIEEVTKHKPQQIEELTFGIFLGAQGMEPEISAVVRLKVPGKLSELTALYPGSLAVELPPPLIKIDNTQAYWIRDDLQTIVIWPSGVAGNGALEGSAEIAADVLPKLDQLLEDTDNQHLITIIGNPNDLQIAAPMLFPAAAQKPMGYLFEWFGSDVEFASWTLHPTPYLYSQISATPRTTSNPAKLKARYQAQLADLPKIMWHDVAIKMQPRELRVRNFVGRYPAMLEAFQQSTVFQNDSEQVTLTTVLPANAAPNLALATLFTVSEAEHTNFATIVAAVPAMQEVSVPETVVGRMKQLELEAEFQAKPIEEALRYICSEIKVELFVDGDAFKDAGWTKNMKQDFNLGKVTGERVLAFIMNKYNEKLSQMVISVDESKKQIHVTTRKFAERDNLPIYEFPKFEQ